MARLFTDGFELQGSAGAWTFATSVVWNLNLSYVRSGAASLLINDGGYIDYSFPALRSEVYVRVAFYHQIVDNFSDQIALYSSTGALHTAISIANNAPLTVKYNGTSVISGTTPTLQNGWYVAELHVRHGTSGLIELQLNNHLEGSWSGNTALGTGLASFRLRRNNAPYGARNLYFDDVAINDTSGDTHQGWCGDGRVVALRPSGNGSSSQWLGSDGDTTANYLLVDEAAPDGDTSYVWSDTSGAVDLYALENLAIGANDVVRLVVPVLLAKETVADSDTLQVGIKSGAVTDWSDEKVLTLNYQGFIGPHYPTNPDGSGPWTAAAVNNLEVGVRVP